MSLDPTASTASDLATSDPALLVPTGTTAAPVTAGEIAAFLRHVAETCTPAGVTHGPPARFRPRTTAGGPWPTPTRRSSR